MTNYLFSFLECFDWVASVYEGNVYANRSSVALFRWKYVLQGALATNVHIKCGYLYIKDDVQNMITLVEKRGHNSDMSLKGQLPRVLNTRVEAHQERTRDGGIDRSVVGFRILYAQLSNPRKYRCESSYEDTNKQLYHKKSSVKTLVVLGKLLFILYKYSTL